MRSRVYLHRPWGSLKSHLFPGYQIFRGAGDNQIYYPFLYGGEIGRRIRLGWAVLYGAYICEVIGAALCRKGSCANYECEHLFRERTGIYVNMILGPVYS